MKLSLGLCRNECVTTVVFVKIFDESGKENPSPVCPRNLGAPLPRPSPCPEASCTRDTGKCPQSARWGGSPANPSLSCGDPSPDLSEVWAGGRGNQATARTNVPVLPPCPRQWGWGVMGDGLSALRAGHLFMSQLL